MKHDQLGQYTDIDPLITRWQEQLELSLLHNFGIKRGTVHISALSRAVRELAMHTSLPIEDAIRLCCKVPMEHDVMRIVVPHCTVSETYFFRHPEHFRWVREVFIPHLRRRNPATANRRQIRCWSAGCSTGEEAYSLAITLSECLTADEQWDISILATDLNPESLAFARKAIYGAWSFRGMSEEVRSRYFTPIFQSTPQVPVLPHLQRYQLDASIARLVTFGELNLHASDWSGSLVDGRSFDLILCRNVAIYFNRPQIHGLLHRFARLLDPEGVLVVGPSESWTLNDSCFRPLISGKGSIFVLSGNRTWGTLQAVPPKDRLGDRTNVSSSLLRQKARPLTPDPSGRMDLKEAPTQHHVSGHSMGHERTSKDINGSPALSDDNNQNKANDPLPPEVSGRSASHARALADLGRYAEAWDELCHLITEQPAEADLYYYRAVVSMNTKDYRSASEDLQKLLFLQPDSIVGYVALAECAAGLGNYDVMRKQYSNALYFLSKMKENDPVPGSEGIPAGAMTSMIKALLQQYDEG